MDGFYIKILTSYTSEGVCLKIISVFPFSFLKIKFLSSKIEFLVFLFIVPIVSLAIIQKCFASLLQGSVLHTSPQRPPEDYSWLTLHRFQVQTRSAGELPLF